MKSIESKFSRKGIIYDLLNRTDEVAFFKLSVENPGQQPECVGFEVVKLCTHEDMTVSERFTPAAEYLPSDDFFGKEGSKTFFAHDHDRAEEYFREFSEEVQLKKAESL